VPFTRGLIQQVVAMAHDTHVQLVRIRKYDTTFPFETPAKIFQRLLNSIMSDRSGTKTSIAYFVGNQLFRCYFKMDNHRMCKMVFDTLSKSAIEKNTLSKADRVTFEYYQGRYELHNLQFSKAREHLLFCFDHCHIAASKQKRYRRLQFLI
jgi:nuclear mRNA export protein PCID2/THP1